MAKLPHLSGAEVCKILADHGFEKVRQKGSHIVMQKKESNTTITVPVPNHDEIVTGTLMSVIRQSKLLKSDFE
ncbi:MAG: type II toxin-antitoxin system HicA family toxin [Spirochaetaceae bacterium]|nr:MAG: type II toxin-antitoxin system HicA family toxin [Spirochaetaceae bacterium]